MPYHCLNSNTGSNIILILENSKVLFFIKKILHKERYFITCDDIRRQNKTQANYTLMMTYSPEWQFASAGEYVDMAN